MNDLKDSNSVSSWMHVLLSNDGITCVVNDEQLRLCKVLHGMSTESENGPTDVIPLANVDGALLLWLHQYLTTHVEATPAMRDRVCTELVARHGELTSILKLSNYLDIPSLHEHACMSTASLLRLCKTSHDMQHLFGEVPDHHNCNDHGAATNVGATLDVSYAQLIRQVSHRCVTPLTH